MSAAAKRSYSVFLYLYLACTSSSSSNLYFSISSFSPYNRNGFYSPVIAVVKMDKAAGGCLSPTLQPKLRISVKQSPKCG